jgi:hypothetical protein
MEDVPLLEEEAEVAEEEELLVYEAAVVPVGLAAVEEDEQQEVLEEEHEQLQPYQLTFYYRNELIHFEEAFLHWVMSSMSNKECCLSSINSNVMKWLLY